MLEARHAVSASPSPRGVRLSECRDIGKIDLRGDPADKGFMSEIGRALDLLLPTEPCQSATRDGIGALWVGPDQWLITCSRADVAELSASLDQAVRGTHASVTDVSAGRTVFRLAGASALDVVAKGCPLDLHPRVAKPGYVAGSVFAKISVLLHLRAADVVDLYFGRSFADYLWAWLEEAGMDCGLIIDR
ncbi:MAG: sarcosine oxidase subunit gamma family protein [Alphaproteobacteria bacterium]